jgi:Domain of unknown function (DUF5666)
MTAGPEHDYQPQPDKPGLRAAWLGSRRVAVMAGVVAVGVLAGAGVAVAATGSSSPSPAPSASAPSSPSARPPLPGMPPKGAWHIHSAPGPFGRAFAGPGLLGGGLFGAVHGTAVVPKQGGGYQTVAFQNGKVTAVSSTSITLRSADGYGHTYQVTSSTMVNAQRDGIGSIKNGNQVVVTATVSGGATTATRIIDLTLLQQDFHHFFGGAAPGANAKAAVP